MCLFADARWADGACGESGGLPCDDILWRAAGALVLTFNRLCDNFYTDVFTNIHLSSDKHMVKMVKCQTIA